MGGFVGIEVAAESGATGRWPVGRYPPMRPGPPDAGGARLGGNAETERVTITIANPRVVNSKSLYALVDVEWGVWQILTPSGSNVSTELLIPGDHARAGSAPAAARTASAAGGQQFRLRHQPAVHFDQTAPPRGGRRYVGGHRHGDPERVGA
jgi:hypothetical protein